MFANVLEKHEVKNVDGLIQALFNSPIYFVIVIIS